MKVYDLTLAPDADEWGEVLQTSSLLWAIWIILCHRLKHGSEAYWTISTDFLGEDGLP